MTEESVEHKNNKKANNPGNDDLILDYIIDYKQIHSGRSPSHREISMATGISSISVVNYNLRKLDNQGRINYGKGTRNISVAGAEWRLT
jgi:predicted MarR family transcription regulator|tara:strand:- start:38 stop:304 length:267 start_codon:yes stop_codon:yes gene_type:complete